MKLHEYQAKELLKSMGTVVPRGGAATTVEEAMGIADELGGNFWVVKAQVHAGGRGKGRFKELVSEDVLKKVVKGIPVDGIGGVALCKTREEVEQAAKTMLGNTLVTKQTGLGGVVVKTIYVTPGADIKNEIYAAVLLDRQKSKLVLMCSTEGGTEIEEVAEHNPDAIKKVWIDPAVGLGGWQAREMAFKLGFTGKAFKGACKVFSCLVNTYLKYDASMVEINPLIIDTEDNVIALDAKMSVDPNASF